jgi:hypothetical protein
MRQVHAAEDIAVVGWHGLLTGRGSGGEAILPLKHNSVLPFEDASEVEHDEQANGARHRYHDEAEQ